MAKNRVVVDVDESGTVRLSPPGASDPVVGDGPLDDGGPAAIEAPITPQQEADLRAIEGISVEDLMQKALDAVARRSQEAEGEAEPEPDEDTEEVIFVRNGWVRVVIAGTRYKLRRPFLGELRDLETSMEADTEVLETQQKVMREAAEKALLRANEITFEVDRLPEGDP